MKYLHKLPHFFAVLTIVVVVFIILSGESEEKGQNYDKYLEKTMLPNQTRWLELFKVSPELINKTAPFISPKAKMVIIVPLEPHMDVRRQEIRSIWANPENSKTIKNGLVSVLFVVNQNAFSDALIETENEKKKDILVVGGQESYKGLVYKLLLAFRWICTYYPLLNVAKIDSDVVLNVDRLYTEVNKEKDDLFVSGFLWSGARTQRDPFDPWFIPESAYPFAFLPTYASGPLYVLSASAIKLLLSKAPKYSVFEVEDVFFTGRLAEESGVERRQMEGTYYRVPKYQPCDNEGRPTIVAYPVHDMKIGLRSAYEQMNTIRCKTLWDRFFG